MSIRRSWHCDYCNCQGRCSRYRQEYRGNALKNYGFNVIDLGKDVEAESIIEAAKTNNADIIALSALMTTTMNQMPVVMSKLKKEGLDCYMMVGGAVVDNRFAQSFGAHYSSDAYSAVKLAEKLIKNKAGA